MSGDRISLDIGICVLTEYDADGFIGVQYDAYGEDKSSAPRVWLQHFYGCISRPLQADDAGGCVLLYERDGAEGNAWLGYDKRVQAKIPTVKLGGVALYDSNGSFQSFDPETRTVTLYVPYAEGKAHLVTVGNDGNGEALVKMASGTGLAVRMLGEVMTLTNADGSSYATLDALGFTVFGPFKAASGADLGGPASMPLAKFAEFASAVSTIVQALVAAGVAGAAATGPAAGVAIAAALTQAATALQAAAAAMNATGATVSTKGA
jgi:hypothetical protein